MEDLEAFAQAAQDRNGVLDDRLVDQHRLEPALQRGVLFDVLAVFVEGGGADQCSSPRASIGLSMLPASMEPSAAPAPTTVCNSSMNSRIRPSRRLHLVSTALSRSSNSPRYFAPATSEPISRAKICLVPQPFRDVAADDALGQALDDGGLADAGVADQHRVVLRLADRIWITRRISASRPITGSSLPARRVGDQVAAVLLQRLVGALRRSLR